LSDYRTLTIGVAIWIGALFQSWSRPWVIAFGLLLLLLLAVASRSLRALLLIAALLLGSTVMSFRIASLEQSILRDLYSYSVEVTAVVSTDAHALAPRVMGTQFAEQSYSALVRVTEIKDGDRQYRLRSPARLISSEADFKEILPGQKIRVHVLVQPSKEGRVAALLINKGSFTVVSQPSRWAKSLDRIRDGLRAASGTGDSGALIPGMVLGDTSLQSATFKNEMRRSGLTHLVAVSGANFAIVSTFILYLMQFVFQKIPLRLGATAIFLISFIALVRPSPSVLRAAAMAAVLLIAQGTHRGRDSLPALGFAIAAVVVADPWQVRDPGFALSVLATAGLLIAAPRLVEKFSTVMPKSLAIVIATPLAATLFCSPVIVAISGQLSLMSIVANVLAAPAVAPITIVGFVAALISPVLPSLSHFLLWCVKPLAAFVAWIASVISDYSVITFTAGAKGFFIIAGVLALGYFFNRKVVITALLILIAISWLLRFPGGDWQIANCDVGQGDSMVVNLGNHRAIVIDTGPDPIAVDRCLHQLGVKKIELLILTHVHADHVGGVDGAIRDRTVVAQWFGNVRAGTRATFASDRGPVTVEVLWPQGQWADEQTSDPNNSSIAVVLRTPDFSLFAGGDMEPLTQAQIAPLVGRVDIYKVCHHGSKFQDESFTRVLSPTISVISVGAGNSYGHPAPETIQSLTRLGSRVLRTDLDGAIAIRANRQRFRIRTSKGSFALLRWS
jgi:competence protein ComEC